MAALCDLWAIQTKNHINIFSHVKNDLHYRNQQWNRQRNRDFFTDKGWNVAATMRNPQKEQELKESSNLKIFTLDVTDPDSIQMAISDAITAFGKIDVLLNNAGYGWRMSWNMHIKNLALS